MPSMKKLEPTEGLSSVWVSDESHFYLNGVVNKASCVLYGTEKPDEVLQKPLHSAKVTVWAAMIGQFGQFFFERFKRG